MEKLVEERDGSLVMLAIFVRKRAGLEMHYRITQGFFTKEMILINRIFTILLICIS